MKRLTLLLTACGWILAGQIVPPGKVRVPESEKPSQPFIWSERRLHTAPELFDAPDEWVDRSLQWVNYILENYPPSLPEHPLRRAALIRLDDVLHIESAPRKELVQKFYRERIERAVAEIERTKVSGGMRIWKLYNLGFVVRTPSVTIAFDIVPGTRQPGFAVAPEVLRRIATQADVMFISHLHNDHAQPDVARLFLELGKPVVAPEGLWNQDAELAARLTYPRRSTELVHPIPVQGGRQILKVVAFPGHQGKSVVNNVHLVSTPDGFTVVQTGDQSNDLAAPGSDFEWISQISRRHQVDLLLPNCWTEAIGHVVRGVNPAVVITGHENEMGHTVDHREDYTQTYTRLHGVPYPLVLMAWGESWHYQRASPGKP